jgi:hypothetical protein
VKALLVSINVSLPLLRARHEAKELHVRFLYKSLGRAEGVEIDQSHIHMAARVDPHHMGLDQLNLMHQLTTPGDLLATLGRLMHLAQASKIT